MANEQQVTDEQHLTDEQAQDAAFATAQPPHLRACGACTELVAGYRGLGRSLAALERPPLPEGFAAGVLARIEARAEARRSEQRRDAALGAASLAVAALCCLWVAPLGWAGRAATALSDALVSGVVVGDALAAVLRALGPYPSLVASASTLLALVCLHHLAVTPTPRSLS
ncbi:MAG: hypothetical protein ACYCWW_20060 [Deltaproteobacteria bacterium]